MQSNGLTERFNQTLSRCLAKVVDGDQRNWDEKIDTILMGYRASKQASTKHSPYYMLFQQHMRLPIDSELLADSHDDGDGEEVDDHEDEALDVAIASLMHSREEAFKKAEANIAHAQKKQKETYNRKHQPKELQEGSEVLLENTAQKQRKGGKIDHLWLGPYTISRSLGKGVYELTNHSGQVIKSKVNVTRLKLYTRRVNPEEKQNVEGCVTKENKDGGKEKDDAMDCEFVEASDDRAVHEGKGKYDGRKEVEEASSTSFLPSGIGATEKVDKDDSQVEQDGEEGMEEDFGVKEKVVEDVGKVEDGREKDMEVDCEVRDKVNEDDDQTEDGREEGMEEDCEVKEKADDKIQNGGEEGIAVNGNIDVDDGKEEDEERRQMAQCMVGISNKGKGKEDERRKGVEQGGKGQGKKRKSNAFYANAMKRRRIPSLSRNSIRQIIEGEMLTDEHISFAQRLLLEQFPTLDGLQSPLLSQRNAFSPVTTESIQIHHTGTCHWVTSTSIGRDRKVCLYDSNFKRGKLSQSMQVQLATVYKLCIEVAPEGDHTFLSVNVPSVQQQRGYTSCGLFAIAFAFHAARGDDLTKISFHQDKMRQHLAKCFKNRHFTPFLHCSLAKGYCQEYPLNQEIRLYCECDMPEAFDDMVACDGCQQWFHVGCVGFKSQAKLSTWFCRHCKSS